MMRTRMSRTAWMSAGLMLVALCSGCASTGGNYFSGWWGNRSTGTYAASQPASPANNASVSAVQTPQQNSPQQSPPNLTPATAPAGSVAGGPYSGNVGGGVAGSASTANNSFPSSRSPIADNGEGACCHGGSCGTASAVTNAATLPTQTSGPLAPAPTADQYGGQKTCPVTGKPLGSMGPPVPVTANGQTLYLCCAGCVEKFQKYTDACVSLVESERHPARSYSGGSSMSCSSCSNGGGGCASCRR